MDQSVECRWGVLFFWLVCAVSWPMEPVRVVGKGWPLGRWRGGRSVVTEWPLKEHNLRGGGSPAGRQVTHSLVDWWGLHQSSGIPSELRDRTQHLCCTERKSGGAWDVPWGLGSGKWSSSSGRSVTHLLLPCFPCLLPCLSCHDRLYPSKATTTIIFSFFPRKEK